MVAKKKIKSLMPQLRFPEFQNDSDWNLNKLSLLAKPIKEKAKKLNPEDVLTLSGEHGLVRQTEYFGKTIAGTDLKRYLRIEQNDFVYNDRTTSAAKYGSLKRLTNYNVGAVSPIYKCFRFGKDENPIFWEHYFDGGAHEDGLSEFVNEGARAGRFNISVDTFLSISVCYPSKTEQQKIADCLDSLDDLIAAHSRKLDALQDHKKGLLQQLFPAEGETTPKLRFPEFEGEWTTLQIGEFGKVVTGSTPATSKREFYDGPRMFVSPADISGQQFIEKTNTTLTDLGFEKTRPIRAGSTLFVCIGSTIGKVAQNREECATNQQINAVIPNKRFSDAFVFYCLLRHSKTVASFAGNQAVPIINKSLFSSLSLLVPEKTEQQKIADCLSDLDALITAQTEQIAALKTHKKGLMQQLFPSS
jgi:type I restriction enzyme S subunit